MFTDQEIKQKYKILYDEYQHLFCSSFNNAFEHALYGHYNAISDFLKYYSNCKSQLTRKIEYFSYDLGGAKPYIQLQNEFFERPRILDKLISFYDNNCIYCGNLNAKLSTGTQKTLKMINPINFYICEDCIFLSKMGIDCPYIDIKPIGISRHY